MVTVADDEQEAAASETLDKPNHTKRCNNSENWKRKIRNDLNLKKKKNKVKSILSHHKVQTTTSIKILAKEKSSKQVMKNIAA